MNKEPKKVEEIEEILENQSEDLLINEEEGQDGNGICGSCNATTMQLEKSMLRKQIYMKRVYH